MFDKIVGGIGAFSYKYRKFIAIFALILFVVVFLVQNFLVIEYSYTDESIVTDIFPQDDTVVMVYENKDENKMSEVINYLQKDEHITSIQGYANTLGAQMSSIEMSEMMQIPVVFTNTLFYMYENSMVTSGLTLVDFVKFMSSDEFLNNEMFDSMIDDGTKNQLRQMKMLVTAMDSDVELSSEEISTMLEVDKQLVDGVFYIAQIKNTNIFNATPMFWATVAETLGMNPSSIEKIFGIKPVTSMHFSEFVEIIAEVSQYAHGIIDEQQLSQLQMLKSMSDIVGSGEEITSSDLVHLFAGAADNSLLNETTIQFMYIMAIANTADVSNMRIPLYDFFNFLSNNILTNEAFSSFLDEEVAAQFNEAKNTIQDGMAQLVGPSHSRMIITLDYELESEGLYSFYDNFNAMLEEKLDGEFYLVGSTAMSDEVSKTFHTEFLMISIITAIAVFLVVWFTFKKLLLSCLLVGVIECAVFSMMSVMVIMNLPMYFIPLILVQGILMGSMIDYGILFTTYYREVRQEYSVEEALPEVMKRATHSILTSSLLIVAVTLICGRFMSGAVASILTTLGIGSLCAIILILFVLPSLLAIFDRHVIIQECQI